MSKRELVADLLAKRADANKTLTALADKAKDEKRALTDTETADFDKAEADVRAFDERITELDAQIRADEAAETLQRKYAAKPGEGVRSEPEIYRSGYGGNSYFRDLHLARNKGDRNALDRLARNDQGRAAEARSSVGITTVNGAGGEFVPPLWLESQFVKLARPGRITSNLIQNQPLPAGTDSINIPKVATGAAVAVQATQNTGVQVTDLTTTSVSSPVTTIAGGQIVSLQLMEQSPLNVDDVILGDLAAAYAVQYNTEILSGSGVGGHQTGILTLAGTNAITYTSAAPTLGGVAPDALFVKLAGAIQAVHSNRYMSPSAIIMHPSRWAWALSQSDTQKRPLVTARAGAFNAIGAADQVAAQGLVGEMLGLPVYVDASIPTNVGGTQDQIIVARLEDLVQWESNVRAEAFQQTYANQLSVFVRVYNYMSFQAARYPKSISVISGTGLVAPTF